MENFFGRATIKFGILSRKFAWNKSRLGTVIDVCFSLTNYHISLYPLRREDENHYQRVLGDYQARIRICRRRIRRPFARIP